jgi:hypothetical protein
VLESKTTLRISAIFVQVISYCAQARAWTSSNTIEDVPRTSYDVKNRPEPAKMQFHLYQRGFNKYTQLYTMWTERNDKHHLNERWTQGLDGKLISLMPSVLEAALVMELENSFAGSSLTLSSLIDQARDLNAPAKSFAHFADLIISTAIAQDEESARVRSLPIPVASRLLGKIINAIREQPDYDVLRAARWIRCVTQMVLDSKSRLQAIDHLIEELEEQQEESLDIVEAIVDEALTLARYSSSDNHRPGQPPRDQRNSTKCYPSDELHWLSAALFNLAVDFYIAEKRAEAEKWTVKAAELADILGRNRREDGGDEGALSTQLRERARRMGLNV